MTWRQKDPKEPDLGLYGKNSKRVNMIAECNDIPLVGISDVDDDIFAEERPKNKRPNIANNRTKLNSVWKTKSKFQCARIRIHLHFVKNVKIKPLNSTNLFRSNPNQLISRYQRDSYVCTVCTYFI